MKGILRSAGLAVIILSLAIACEGLSDLSTLQQGLASEFQSPGVGVNLHNNVALTVLFENSPYAKLPEAERAALARRVAEFVRDRYPGYARLQSVHVGFVTRRGFGPVQFTQSEVPYRFMVADLGRLPERRTDAQPDPAAAKTQPPSELEAPKVTPEAGSPGPAPSPLASLVPIPLEVPPADPVSRARFLLDNRRWDSAAMQEAARELAKVLKADPKNAMALTQAARVTYFAGYHSYRDYDPEYLERATRLVDQALAVDPRLPEAHVVRGYILFFQKNLAGARQAGLEAERLRPGDSWANTLLASVASHEKRYDEAHARAQIALRNATTRSQQLNALGELTTVFKAQGDLVGADQVYSAIIRIEPESPWARVNYAGFLTNWTKDHDRAMQFAQEALTLMDFPMAHKVLSEAALRRGNELVQKQKDWVRAGDYYATAAQHDPRSADAHYGLAMSFWFKADQMRDRALIDQVGRELEIALKLDPKHEQARWAQGELVKRGWRPSK